jgi:hypothetical protein
MHEWHRDAGSSGGTQHLGGMFWAIFSLVSVDLLVSAAEKANIEEVHGMRAYGGTRTSGWRLFASPLFPGGPSQGPRALTNSLAHILLSRLG